MREFPDGVRFVDLAPLADGSLVIGAIASAVEAKDEQGSATVETLVRSLEGTKTLMILDNCEQVTQACADAVRIFCAPGRACACSRPAAEPLGLAGEMQWRVPSLSLPESAMTIDEVARCEAVQLFLDRAAAARPGFAMTAANAGPITEICRSLEGVPLAIELAAARTKALTPREIRDRLSDRFRLLTGGRGRHQTLRSTIDWSYDLLSESEQKTFPETFGFCGRF